MKMDTTPRRAGRTGAQWEAESEWENDRESVAQRTKEVQFTQSQAPYKRLIALYRINPDLAEHFPVSPDPRRRTPRRVWEKELRVWREELENFDHPDIPRDDGESRPTPPSVADPVADPLPRRYTHKELHLLRPFAASWSPPSSAPWADAEKSDEGWTTLWMKDGEEERQVAVPVDPSPPEPTTSPSGHKSLMGGAQVPEQTAEELFPAGEAGWIREEERTPPVTPATGKTEGQQLGDISNTASPDSSVGPLVSSPPLRRVVVVTDRQAAQRAAVLSQLNRMQEQQAALLARQQLLRQQMLASKLQQLKLRSTFNAGLPNAGLPNSSWTPPIERCNAYTDVGAHVAPTHAYAPPEAYVPQRTYPDPGIEQSYVYSPQRTQSGAQYFEHGGAHYFTE